MMKEVHCSFVHEGRVSRVEDDEDEVLTRTITI
jgi:hypothetical protein